jgi:phosphoenolpyruvate carboxykinase (ATP)
MITEVLNGEFAEAEFKHDDTFNLDVPQSCPGVPAEILNPRDTWADKEAYDKTAKKLAGMFHKNFTEKYPNMPAEIVQAGPKGY